MRQRLTRDLGRPNSFDAMRVALAVAVIFSHAYRVSSGDAPDPIARFSVRQTDVGAMAVFAFFGISGYLITASIERSRSTRDFLSRRIRRIYPGFVVALAISAFVVSPLFVRDGTHVDILRVAVKFVIWAAVLNPWTRTHAFLHNPMPGVVNGSLWTVQYEFACYLLLLIIAAIGGLRDRRRLLVVAACVYAVHVARCVGWIRLRDVDAIIINVGVATTLTWVSCFLAGSVAYLFRDRLPLRPLPALLCVLTLSIALRAPSSHALDVIVPLAWTYGVLTIASARLSLTVDFARRVGGDYSYGTYLYAFPIQQMLVFAAGGTMSPLANVAIATPLALACGVASWHLVEKRFVRRDRREAVATIVPDAT